MSGNMLSQQFQQVENNSRLLLTFKCYIMSETIGCRVLNLISAMTAEILWLCETTLQTFPKLSRDLQLMAPII